MTLRYMGCLLIALTTIAGDPTLPDTKVMKVSQLGELYHPPMVYLSDSSVFLVNRTQNQGTQVWELDPALTSVQATYVIKKGQGPCEGMGLEFIGALDRELFVLRSGREIIAFDNNGKCRSVSRLTGKGKQRLSVVSVTGEADRCLFAQKDFSEVKKTSSILDIPCKVALLEDFQSVSTIVSGLPCSPLPPWLGMMGDQAVITAAGENTPESFFVHVIDLESGNKRSVVIRYAVKKTPFEMEKARSSLAVYRKLGVPEPSEKDLKRKVIGSQILSSEATGCFYFIERVKRSETDHSQYLHELNPKTLATRLIEIPANYEPRAIRDTTVIGFLKDEWEECELAVMELRRGSE